jgi:hypothetical protein
MPWAKTSTAASLGTRPLRIDELNAQRVDLLELVMCNLLRLHRSDDEVRGAAGLLGL